MGGGGCAVCALPEESPEPDGQTPPVRRLCGDGCKLKKEEIVNDVVKETKKTMVDGINLNPLQRPMYCQSNHRASSPILPDGKPNPSPQQRSTYSSNSYLNLACPIPASNFCHGR